MKLLLIMSLLPFILAFSFSPMSQTIELGEKQKGAQFQISNDSEEKIAIELTVKERVMDVEGKETLPDTTEISVFPPQMIIPAREKRTVRVNWSGSKNIKSEKAFRVIAEQLPLKVDEKTKKKSGIQMLMKYMAALYVSPANAESKIQVVSYVQSNGEVRVTVDNKGSKHQVLLDPVLAFDSGTEKHTLKAQDLTGLAGENVLANSQRIFTIKTNKKLPPKAALSLKVND